MSDSSIRVEVAYALPDRQQILELLVPRGTTAREAIDRSGIVSQFESLVVDDNTMVGIFGCAVSQDYVVEADDRVEIYRPLAIDPKEARRRRAEQSRDV